MMKVEEPRAMYEVHKIRIKLWEEEKNLFVKEKVLKHKKALNKFIKENKLENRVVFNSGN